jgi:hypothetical protein
VAGVEEASGGQLGPDGTEQAGGGGLHRQLDRARRERVVDRYRARERAAHVDVRQRAGGGHAVEAHEPGLGVPRQHRGAGAPGAGRRADHDVGRGQRVEVPDDLVGRGLRQAEGRDERADTDDGPEHRERHAGRPREEPGDRLAGEVARSHARPR